MLYGKSARHFLQLFAASGVVLDRQLEEVMERLQIAVRDARNANIHLGGVYDKNCDGIQYPINTEQRPYGYASILEFERDLDELLATNGLNTIVDAGKRRYAVALVPVFTMLEPPARNS